MKKHRYLAAFIMTVAMIAMLVVTASASYKIGSWAENSLQYATMAELIDKEDYIRDYTAPILREDLAELMYDAYTNITGQAPAYAYSYFEDTYNHKVAAMNELGIMIGTSNTTFSPEKYATRQEMARIIVCFQSAVRGTPIDTSNADISNIADNASVTIWSKPYVRLAIDRGLMKLYSDNTFRPYTYLSWEEALAEIVRVGGLKTKPRPTIKAPVNEQCIVTKNKINFVFDYYGKYNLYAVKVEPQKSYIKSLGSCEHNNNVPVYPYSFNTNCIYYVFAEKDGVFSKPVKIYTDSKVIIKQDYDYHAMGPVTVNWLRFPGSGAYTVTITEQRLSAIPGTIGPNTPVTATVPTASSYTFNANPNKKYIVQLSSGGYTAKTEIYTSPVYNDTSGITRPNTQAEAKALMKTISVPVWKLVNGKKVPSTASLTVHHLIADKVKLVFQEIYNGPEKFPIHSIGGFSWRASSTSEHNCGTAIDINSNENYCIYNNGTVVGSFWKPGVSPYSIKPYGDVVRAFEKYGFTWGGDSWYSGTKDYMHFSYMGT